MEIDLAGLTQNIKQAAEPIEVQKENKWWEAPGSPPGSTKESLAVYENGKPVRALGATHYLHLADGRVVPGIGIATHYSEDDGDGGERVTRVVACHAA